VATVAETHAETSSSRTIVFDTPGWPGHLPGQHVDMRLTAEDGYSTQRSYSIAASTDGDRVALSVQRVPGGEVSPYLVDEARPGDRVELRGPIGGWFVWRHDDVALGDKLTLVRAVIELVGDRTIAVERERLSKVMTFAGLRRWRGRPGREQRPARGQVRGAHWVARKRGC
jgi:NAD(P)H-flavin reductase